jgi:hypothetical protein
MLLVTTVYKVLIGCRYTVVQAHQHGSIRESGLHADISISTLRKFVHCCCGREHLRLLYQMLRSTGTDIAMLGGLRQGQGKLGRR